MARVIWSRKALARLDQITRHIAQDNPIGAADFAGRLVRAGDSLADFPARGRPASKGLRELMTYAPYILVYRVIDDVVVIERLRHSAQAEDY